mgnify:FL=1
MKRVGIFLLVGPLLGLAMAMILTARISPSPPSVHLSADFLWFAYLAGLIPSMVSAAVNLWLANKSWNVLATVCAGTAATVLEMLALHGDVTAPELLAFGLFGAIPAAVCAWLSAWPE